MRRWQVTVLLTLLIGVFLFCDSALCCISMPTGNPQPGWRIHLAWMGMFLAQPGLLAMWAAFGSEPLFVRLPRSFFLACLVSLAVTWGTWLNQGGYLDADSSVGTLMPFFMFATMLLLFWPIRVLRSWRIVGPYFEGGILTDSGHRFSLRRLLVWQSLAAVALAAGSLLFRDSTLDGSQGTLLSALAIGTIQGILLLPILFNLGATLGTKNRTWFIGAAVCFACLVLGAALIVTSLVNGKVASGEIGQLLTVLLSFHIAIIGSLLIVRSLGYRLVHATSNFAATVAEKEKLVMPSTRQFAIAAIALLLFFSGMIPLTLDLQEKRFDRREEVELIHLGFRVDQREDGTVQANFFVNRPIKREALVKLRELPHLQRVQFASSQIRDQQLESVGQITDLKILDLRNTPITDAGLQHLKDLQCLDVLYLGGSRVTPKGVKQLQDSLPDCRIIYP